MAQYEYTVIIEAAEEGSYIARVPALDDLTTEGDTLEEVKYMVQDAIKGYLEVLRKKNLPIWKYHLLIIPFSSNQVSQNIGQPDTAYLSRGRRPYP